MTNCIVWTFIIGFSIAFATTRIFWQSFYSAFAGFGASAALAALFLAVFFATYFFVKYIKQKYEQRIANKEKELEQLQEKINDYQSRLDKIGNLQNAITESLQVLITINYKILYSKEVVIDALRHKKGKELENSLKHGSISEKGAQRVQKRFTKILENIDEQIQKNHEAFQLILGDAYDSIKKYIQTLKKDNQN